MVKLGAVICTNWVYLNPLVTIVFAWLVLSEEITLFFLLGASFILLGLFLSSRKPLKTQKVKEKRKGNNPMVGATVACAVAVAEAL